MADTTGNVAAAVAGATAGYGTELATAMRAVTTAAKLCESVASELDFGVLDKADRSPVTVADFGSQALVCRELEISLPYDPVMAEEDSSSLRDAGNEELLDQVVGVANFESTE